MSKALKKDASYADLCAVPEDFVAEILAGELYATPRPGVRHVRVASTLGILLGGPYQLGINGPGAGLFWTSLNCTFERMLSCPISPGGDASG